MRETTALGATIAAGFAVGVWKDFEELKGVNSANRTVFRPQMPAKQVAKLYNLWTKAVEMCRGWVETEEQQTEA
jgi:glycerol kinase